MNANRRQRHRFVRQHTSADRHVRIEPLERRKLLSASLDGGWWGVGQEAGYFQEVETDVAYAFNEDVYGGIFQGQFDATFVSYDGNGFVEESELIGVERDEFGRFMLSDSTDVPFEGSGGVDPFSQLAWFRETHEASQTDENYSHTMVMVRGGQGMDFTMMAGEWAVGAYEAQFDSQGEYAGDATIWGGHLHFASDFTWAITGIETADGTRNDLAGTWTWQSNGEFDLFTGSEHFLHGAVNEAGTAIVVSDSDPSDGVTLTGTGVREVDHVLTEMAVGQYRITHTAFDGVTRELDQLKSNDYLLDLKEDGNYALFDLADVDEFGIDNVTPIQTGEWAVETDGFLSTFNRSNDDVTIDAHFDPTMTSFVGLDMEIFTESSIGWMVGTAVGDGDAGGPPTFDYLLISELQDHAPGMIDTDSDGMNFWVSTWTDFDPLGGTDVFAQVFNLDGFAIGDAFVVNETGLGFQGDSRVSMHNDGSFAISWTAYDQDGDGAGVYARAFGADGSAITGEFLVNQNTVGDQGYSDIWLADDYMKITWTSEMSTGGVNAMTRVFDTQGIEQSSEMILGANLGSEQTYNARIDGDAAGTGYAIFAHTNSVEDLHLFDWDGVTSPFEQHMPGLTEPASLAVEAFNLFDSSANFLLTLNDAATPVVGGADISVDESGSFFAAWTTLANGETDSPFGDTPDTFNPTAMAGTYYDAVTGTLSTPAFVSEGFGDILQYDPDIEIIDPGRATISWTSRFLDPDGVPDHLGRMNARFIFNDLTSDGSEFDITPFEFGDYGSTATTIVDGEAIVSFIANHEPGTNAGAIFLDTHNEDIPDVIGDIAPAVAMDAQGNFVMTWTNIDPETNDPDIFVQRYDAEGHEISDKIRVNTTTADAQFMSQIAMNDNGDFIVTWTGYDPVSDSDNVYGQIFTADMGLVGGEFVVSDTPDGMQDLPQVAMSNNGQIVVVWANDNFDGTFDIDILAKIFNADGTPASDGFAVHDVLDGVQDEASVAIDSNGNFIVTWTEFAEDSMGHHDTGTIWARRFDASGAPTDATPFMVSDGINNAFQSSISTNDAGEFVVTWVEEGVAAEGVNVMARWFNADGTNEDAFVANTTRDGDQIFPRVSLNQDGEFIVAWTHLPNGTPGFDEIDQPFALGEIQAQGFGRFGVRMGEEIQAFHPDVAPGTSAYTGLEISGTDASFVLSWMAVDADTDTSNVYFQIFSEGGGPILDVDAGDPVNADEGTPIDFVGTIGNASSDGLTFSWDFGDGFGADTLEATHTYAEEGEYIATLTVYDAEGAPFSDTVLITVGNVAPIVSVEADTAGNEGDLFTFFAHAEDPGGITDPLTFEWDFGDGNFADGPDASNVFHRPGDFVVTLTVTDDEGAQTIETIEVSVANVDPIVNIGFDRTVELGSPVEFFAFAEDPSGDPMTFEWDFGDQTVEQGTDLFEVMHTYADEGEFTVTLTVTDEFGGFDTATLVVTVVAEDAGIPATPAAPTLMRDSDSGANNEDGITNFNNADTATALEFKIDGVTSGATVRLFDGETLVAEGVANSGSIRLFTDGSTVLDDGFHFFFATQEIDGVQGSVSETTMLVIDTSSPEQPDAPIILSDEDGDGSTSVRDIELTGFADPGSLVEIYRDSGLRDTVEVSADGSWTFLDRNPSLGLHTYTVRSIDLAGNTSGFSDAVQVTKVRPAPDRPAAPTLLDEDGDPDADGLASSARPQFTGIADAGLLVRLYVNGEEAGRALTDDAGAWTITPNVDLEDGRHKVSVTVAYASEADAAESRSSSSINVEIDTQIDALSMPELDPRDDSGASNEDGITDTERAYIKGEGAEGGALIVLRDQSGNIIGSTIAANNGRWGITPLQAFEDGTYFLTATQTDAAGNESLASDPMTLIVDTTAPDAPDAPDLDAASDTGDLDDDNITASRELTFTGTAEAGAMVQLMRDGRFIGDEVTAGEDGSWTITVDNVRDGEATWQAIVTDIAGNVQDTGDTVVVTVSTKAPFAPGDMELDAASDSGEFDDDGVTNVTTPTINGTGEIGDTVTLYDTDGVTVLGTTTVDSDGNWSITTTTLSEGRHEITAIGTNAVGADSRSSRPLIVEIDLTADQVTAPTLRPGKTNDTGRSDTDGITSNPRPLFEGSGAERDSMITLRDQDGTVIGTAFAKSNGDWLIEPEFDLNGTYTMTAEQTDAAGNTSAASDGFDIVIDTDVPTPASAPDLDSTSDTGDSDTDDITASRTLVFTGTAEAGAEVQLLRDGRRMGDTIIADETDGSWTVTINNVRDGEAEWTVQQTDAAGNVQEVGDGLTVTVLTKAPAKVASLTLDVTSDTGTSTTDGITNDTTPTFTGTGLAGAAITLYSSDGITVIGSTVADGDGNWAATVDSPLVDGQHQIRATQTDQVGNESRLSKGKKITIDSQTNSAFDMFLKLTESFDTGESGVDGITSRNMPRLEGGGAEKGSIISIRDQDDNIVASVAAKSNGTWRFDFTDPLNDGSYEFTTVYTDIAGNVSESTDPLSVVIDTTAADASGAPDLDDASDDGQSGTDNITSQRDLTFNGTAEAGSTVFLFRDGRRVGEAIADDNGDWIIATLGNPLGTSLWSFMQVDLAGNESPLGTALEVTILDE